MKKGFSTLLLLSALSLTGCIKDKLINLADITFTQPYSAEVTLPATSTTADSLAPLPVPGGSAALPAFAYTFPVDLAQQLKDNNSSLDKLVAVKLDGFTMVPLLPAGRNLDFINSIELKLSAPGMQEISVANKKPFPKGASSVSLDVSDASLKDYFLKDSVTIRILADVNAVPPAGTKIRFDSKFKITANPLK